MIVEEAVSGEMRESAPPRPYRDADRLLVRAGRQGGVWAIVVAVSALV
ncbi:MAG: hypothetical protein QOJ63_2875, partial [Solirubrobacteraceae bacterium]|nr:hypothetical protein [Solirubrobacteraceae bacterium]